VDTYQRGFVANGRDQQPGIPPDLKESFDMGVDLPRSHHAVADGVPMHGPNQWPSHCPWLRGPTEDYFEVLRALGEKLLGAFACSVGEPEGFFEEMVDEAMVQMRMFRYFPLPEDSATYGSFEHTDYGMFTLLSPDPIGGLELKTRSGEWCGGNDEQRAHGLAAAPLSP
jgi:isopenicillin N synthase-like dioxygenase